MSTENLFITILAINNRVPCEISNELSCVQCLYRMVLLRRMKQKDTGRQTNFSSRYVR